MGRKRSGLEGTAFEPPFYTPTIGSHAYKIPEDDETELLEIYTKLTQEKPDIEVDDLAGILENEFRMPVELVPSTQELHSWAIEGTNVVDFEKWLYNGYFWLLLNKHIDDVDMLWQDVWAALDPVTSKNGGEQVQRDKDALRSQRLYLSDVKKLIEVGKLDANAVSMLQTAGNGKVYIGYVDFFILLGRLGVFKA
ncbi:hypothetical protein PMKS-002107 [Pichia membranifaciens]|uniref:Uncharacterized protein n=1 Tax=Pichia membranifaciens TaxID=4926 RepID=A0A1Q2YGX4_9ASCO|nr:hypothetical protein PMKS-002107 [Pichia membranifaciens]